MIIGIFRFETNMNQENKRKDTSVVLEQWKTCVEMANAVSQRRDVINNIFITLTASILTAMLTIKEDMLSIVGISICIIWKMLIHNFKILNETKFEVINEMEQLLPKQPFNDEWKKLVHNQKYHDSTAIEAAIPCIMGVGFLIFGIVGHYMWHKK